MTKKMSSLPLAVPDFNGPKSTGMRWMADTPTGKAEGYVTDYGSVFRYVKGEQVKHTRRFALIGPVFDSKPLIGEQSTRETVAV